MYSMARFAGAMDDRTQDFEGSAAAYVSNPLHIHTLSQLTSPADG